jgi:hypothetical protein
MPPDLQKLMESQTQAYQQASDVSVHFKLLIYSSYAALLICAIFSILIFWKLCQIQKQLAAKPSNFNQHPVTGDYAATPTPPDFTASESDDDRFRPKS